MTAHPLWFSSGKLTLFGWMNLPADGYARAGVVLCPPLGNELLSAHDTLRALAEDLARRGFAVLRFDYPGTGDSGGHPTADDLVPLWLQAVSDAVRRIRSAGVQEVVVVGMRMGATLAALSGADDAVDAVVLWDPSPSGKVFLRQQRALATLLAETATADSAAAPGEIPGYVYSERTVAHISALRLRDAPRRLAARVLILVREASLAPAVVDHFDERGLTWGVAEGQEELLERSTVLAEIPTATVVRIAEWIDATVIGPAWLTAVPVEERAVLNDDGGVTEHFVRLGPLGLFGIRTEPAHPTGRPVMVFLNVAAEVHIGPSRQWVEWARSLAGHGFSSVRVDLSGLGDSPIRTGQQARQAYGRHLLEDVGDVVAALSSFQPADVVMVGLCSGGYAALQAGASLGVRGVIAINPAARPDEDPRIEASPNAADLRRSKSATAIVQSLPPTFWRLGDALRLLRSPAGRFEDAVAGIEDTLIVCSADSARILRKRGGWIVDRLTRTNRFSMVTVDVDHSMLAASGRETVAQSVMTHVVHRYGAPGPGPDRVGNGVSVTESTAPPETAVDDQVARPLARGFSVLTSSRAIILSLQFVAFALMASHLQPNQLGVYVFAMAFAELFTLVTDFGFQATVARDVAQRPEDESWLLPNLAYLRLVLACFGYVLIIAALTVIGYGENTREAGLLAGLILFVSAFDGFQVVHQVRVRMTTIALGGLVQAILMVVGVLLLRSTHGGVDPYILLTAGASMANAVVVTAAAIRTARLRWRPLPAAWAPLVRAALPLGLASAVIALYYRLDLLILTRLKSADAVGQYGAGYKFIDTLNVLPAMVVTVLGPVFARGVVGSGDVLQRRYRQAIHLVWLLALPIGLIGAMTAFRLLPLLPGFEHYRGAGRALAILAPAGALILVSTVLSSVLISGGQQRRLLRTSLVVLVVSVVFDVALIPPLSYAGAAIATVITEAMTVGLSMWMIHRYLGLRWPVGDVVRTVPALLITTGVLAAGYALNPFAQAALAVLAYVLCLFVTPALHLSDVPGLFQRSGPVTFVMGQSGDRRTAEELCARWPHDGTGWRWVVLGAPDELIGSLEPYDTHRYSGRHILRLRRTVKGSSVCVLVGLQGRQRAVAQLVSVCAFCQPVILPAGAARP